jgi:hypothetical protein
MIQNIPDHDSHDRDLREQFAGLRHEDAAQAPSFAGAAFSGTPGRTGRKRKPAWLRYAAAATAVLIVAALVLAKFYPRPHTQPEISITEWESPTDFLLETPGHEVLEGVPEFLQVQQLNTPALGEWPGGSPTPADSPTPRRNKTS